MQMQMQKRSYVFVILVNIYIFFIKLNNFIKYLLGIKPEKRIETITDASKRYVFNRKEWFLNKTEKCVRQEITVNISPIFYSKPEYNTVMQEISNYLEKEWKTRILYETTPKGNIIMYYDVYKLGFVYFSDMNGIDYHLLNAIAMKYVITYRCLDFFVDNEITEKYGNSPLLKLHFLDNEKDKKDDKDTETDGDGKKHTNNHTKKDKKIDESTRNMLKDAPFVKYRKANNGPPTNGEKNKDQTQTQNQNQNQNQNQTKNQNQNQNHPPKECVRNKFICMGKTLNFQFTQKKNTKNKFNNFVSKYSDIFSQETDLQKRVLSYRDFKNQEKSEFSTEPPAPPETAQSPQAD